MRMQSHVYTVNTTPGASLLSLSPGGKEVTELLPLEKGQPKTPCLFRMISPSFPKAYLGIATTNAG